MKKPLVMDDLGRSLSYQGLRHLSGSDTPLNQPRRAWMSYTATYPAEDEKHSLSGWRVPPEFVHGHRVEHIYAEPLFADVVAGPLGLALLEAPLDWLLSCPEGLRRRRVESMTLSEARDRLMPGSFVKAWDDKSIRPAVYESPQDLPGEDVASGGTPLLVQGVLRFVSEYRMWCLDGVVVTGSRYAIERELAESTLADAQGRSALSFAAEVLAEVSSSLPSGAVLDVGLTPQGWAVVEVNAAWGSGLYASDEDDAMAVILASTALAGEITEADKRFVRKLPEVQWK